MLSKLARLKGLLSQLGKIDEILWRLDQISRSIHSRAAAGDRSAVSGDATQVGVPALGVSPAPVPEPRGGVTMSRLGSESLVSIPNGPHGLFVPLDYLGVIQTRTQDYLYQAVRDRVESDRDPIDRFLAELSPFLSHPSLDKVPDDELVKGEPYWNNGYFPETMRDSCLHSWLHSNQSVSWK